MGELETNEKLNIDFSLTESVPDQIKANTEEKYSSTSSSETDMVEYKEVEEPCVALTIIGENKLTDAEVFVKRGIKYSIKAFFSAIILTIMNLFI